MPKGLDPTQKTAFYASKVVLINRELTLLSRYWQRCTMKPNNKVDKFGVEIFGVTCLRALVTPCEACANNEAVYKEKRKLKAQFSKALGALCLCESPQKSLCSKEEPSFTDLNECSFYEEDEE
tara:strand:- start:679 stop:1047 length:369 start_codon:yes stop_codon:yes gene_type:complete